jgi:outer membrane protein OmpA-like peptidoglycan-associated protein
MKRLLSLQIIVLVLFCIVSLDGQNKDWNTKFGLRGGLLFPENEYSNLGFWGNNNFSFDWFKFSYLFETYVGAVFSKNFELQLNVGFGNYCGKAYSDDTKESYGEYSTTIYPVYLKLKINPWDSLKWNPYFYFGGGGVVYSVGKYPVENIGDKPPDHTNTTGLFPLGIGVEYEFANNLLLDFSLGGAISTGYFLDGYDNSKSDAVHDSYINLSVGVSLNSESCNSDRDNDKLGRCDEEKMKTDPGNPDTDGDGLSDGEEVFIYKTDPLKLDTDGDGLSDTDEVKKYMTNPNSADTDSDLLSDGEEINTYSTNPLKYNSDDDDFSDSDEVLIYKTNPLRADSDGDGLSDGGEILTFKTDPLNIDTDGEGLSDGDEVIKYKTDPNKTDTDSGSVDDFTEIRRGTDPLDPEDDIIQTGVPIVLEGITFETGKADITPESESILQSALETMKTYPDMVVEISGHTDNTGDAQLNKTLSQKRADSVRNYLINKGIEPDRIIAIGYGEEIPRVPNDSSDHRRMNRRIEFKRIR